MHLSGSRLNGWASTSSAGRCVDVVCFFKCAPQSCRSTCSTSLRAHVQGDDQTKVFDKESAWYPLNTENFWSNVYIAGAISAIAIALIMSPAKMGVK